MSPPLRLGTRGSRLALWQAEWVRDGLAALRDAPPIEIVRIETSGDRIQNVPLSTVGGRDFFTKDIEDALLDGRIDFAVHSLKDLATALPSGLALGAVLERADPRDALVSPDGIGFDDLPEGARVGTSSLRRIAFLRRARPDLQAMELRGNVPTRLAKLDRGEYDAVLLACAGLDRLGLGDRISERLDVERFTPAPGQGAVGIEIRADDPDTAQWIVQLQDAETRGRTDAERAFLNHLGGGCSVPIGAFSRIDDGRLHLFARVGALDGRADVHGAHEGRVGEGDAVGRELAERLAEAGAGEILEAIRTTAGGTG